LRIADHAVGEIARSGANHGHRRAQLMRDRRDEFHLLPRKLLRPARRHRDQSDDHGQQHQDARADHQIAGAHRGHGRLERSRSMLRHQHPSGVEAAEIARPGDDAPGGATRTGFFLNQRHDDVF
jgi:hypothetical protein